VGRELRRRHDRRYLQTAGVRTGSFYYFYKSKADLAVAALEKLWKEEWKPALDEAFSSSLDPLSRLTGYLGALHAKITEQKQKHGKVLGCPICSVGSESAPRRST